MTAYISIPITGHDFATTARHEAEVRSFLRSEGYSIISPLDCWQNNQPPCTESWEWWMVRDLQLIDQCDTLYLCHGWQHSAGCRLERAYAELHNLEIIEE